MRIGSSDSAVRATNDDAQVSKASCVRLGYFKDDFLKYFVRPGSARRAPIINRGYYSRTAAIKHLIQQFLLCGGPSLEKQILSLGAGFDTTWFHLKASGTPVARYYELDFPEVLRKKEKMIGASEELMKLIGAVDHSLSARGQGKVVSAEYVLLPGDLREVDEVMRDLEGVGFRTELPTLIIAECVLVYMPPDTAQRLVSELGRRLPTAAFLVYEQIKPYDAFGEQMMINLEKRGCPLIGIHGSPSLEEQRKRFTQHNWQSAWAEDMDTVYTKHTDPQDRRRIERLEIFDEMEEWHLIQEHYCLAVGINDAQGVLESFHLPTYQPATLPFPVPGLRNAD